MSILTRVAKATVVPFFLLVTLSAPPVFAYEEIIVSARKVDESIQDVPLAITALSSEKIERAGIQDLSDIAAFTPGLSFFSPIGEFLPTPIIRGIAQTDIFGETNVGIYVDGVYVAGREGLNFNFLDLERIETIKGPQSAIYGRNSFSGAINYVTKRAPENFEVKTDGTVGSDDRLAGQISVGGPIFGDTLRGVASVGYDDFDGTYDDNTGGNDIGGRKYETYFGKLEFLPFDNLEMIGTVYYSDDKIDDSATASLVMNCQDIADPATATSPRFGAFCGDIPDLNQLNNQLGAAGFARTSGDNTINKIPAALGEERELTRAALNTNWDTDVGTFSFVVGYSKTEQQAKNDGGRNLGEQQPFEYCSGPACPGFAGVNIVETGLLQVEVKDETEEWSQELRYTSDLDKAFRFGGGGYHFDLDVDDGNTEVIATQPLPADFQAFGPFVVNGLIAIGDAAFLPWFTPNGSGDTDITSVSTDIESWAGFGWGELDFADRFTLRAEIRYTYQEEKLDRVQTVIDDTVNPNVTTVTRLKDDDDWDFWTGRLNLKYQVNDDWMIYGQVANGTKSGTLETVIEDTLPGTGSADATCPSEVDGVPAVQNNQVCTILPVANEKNTSYEVGAKGVTLDGKLLLEGSVFYTDWSDAALRGTFEVDPITGSSLEQPQAVTQIVGEADVWGWDMQGSFAPDEFWNFTFGLSYTDATWDDAQLASLILFPAFGNQNQDCRVDLGAGETVPKYCGQLDGNQVARQPPWQGNFSAQYTTPINMNLLNENWEVFGRADFTYEDDWFSQDDNLARIQDHTYTNLRLGLNSDRYAVELWVKNVFEEDDASAAFRDVFFGNNDNIYNQRPVGQGPNQFFPFRYTLNYPTLRTWGLTVRARFGGD
jgi:iron complex outermembrane receptor protein